MDTALQPLETLQLSYPGKQIVVGAAVLGVFNDGSKDSQKTKLLILQRARTEDMYPLMYELPGGHTENSDATLFDAVAREVFEETGLTVKRIVKQFDGFEYQTKKGTTVQLNFFVEVQNQDKGVPAVKMDPTEHEAFAWICPEDDVDLFPMTPSMSVVIKDALRIIQKESP